VDPFYLTWKARSVGMHTHFIERAGQINIHMPTYVVQHVQGALNDDRKSLNGSRILLMGIAYKGNIGDTRETPAFVIWEQLLQAKATVSYYDPHVPTITGHLPPNMSGLQGVSCVSQTGGGLAEAVSASDAIVIVTTHKCVPLSVVQDYKGPIIDTRNWVPESMGLRVYKA